MVSVQAKDLDVSLGAQACGRYANLLWVTACVERVQQCFPLSEGCCENNSINAGEAFSTIIIKTIYGEEKA